jgi:hypothetical protein
MPSGCGTDPSSAAPRVAYISSRVQPDALDMVVPLRDGAPFLTLARAVLDALGVDAALPSPEAFAAPSEIALRADALRARVRHTTQRADPYAGGSIDTQALSVEGPPGRRVRVSVDAVAWVGDELTVTVRGSAAWVAAVEPAVRAFVAAWER